MKNICVHYGCGLVAPKEWLNFDISPTLRIQKTPIIGLLLRKRLNTIFPQNVLYGDIVKGLPIDDNTCDAIYCAHVLEHLSLEDFRKAIKNTYRLLKKGGVFRCVVPYLEEAAIDYLNNLQGGNHSASIRFVGKKTLLGLEKRKRGIKGLIIAYLGNSGHRWMWDQYSLSQELKTSGFINLRNCYYNDSNYDLFKLVEDPLNYDNAVAIECYK